MSRSIATLWLVQLTTLSRLLAALLFASLAFQNVPRTLIIGLYVFAIASDLLDGYLARKLKAVTHLGQVLDLLSDKSLTIISLLYAAARDIDLLPLALIASREVITLGLRIVIIEGEQLLPTNRVLGGIMAVMLWGNTLFLMLTVGRNTTNLSNATYWVAAAISVSILSVRLYSNADRIRASLTDDS